MKGIAAQTASSSMVERKGLESQLPAAQLGVTGRSLSAPTIESSSMAENFCREKRQDPPNEGRRQDYLYQQHC